ncbi:MAG: T9SS type A sorting domain-containing protein [Bacteroidota bacterium]|nr:T9SS type A sorting domain-containing protein [Bacteroidota bacterium]
MKKISLFLVCVILFAVGVSSLKADNLSQEASPVNIALGRSYTWNVPPNYVLCTDADDKVQLTDGKYTSGQPFWAQKSTVGWQNSRSVTIIIDLGTDRPISGFAVSTAAGTAGVSFPRDIFVMTSPNGNDFYMAGDLVQMANLPLPAPTPYSKFTYNTTNVKTHGRYVLLTCTTPDIFIFMDEIEVYEGTPDFLNEPYSGLPISIYNGDLSGYHTSIGCYKRYANDIVQIRKRLATSVIASDLKKSVADNLDLFSAQANNFSPTDAVGFRAVVPFNDLHKNILACFGQILEYEGFPVLTVWHSHRYAPLSLFETPDKGSPSLSLQMMQNEYRSEAFNLTNAGKTPLDVSFRLEGLPDCVEVRQVEYVDTREGIVAADALTPVKYLSGSYRTTVPSGMTRQIWLTFNPKTTGAANYSGSIKVDAGDIQISLPLALRISQSRFPDSTSLSVGVWDYAVSNSLGINAKNKDKVIADLRSHFVNVAFGDRRQAAIPKASDVDVNGHITEPLDFSAFDDWLRIWPDAKHYQIFCAVTLSDNSFAGITRGTSAFKHAVKEWATAWDVHVQDLKLSKGRVQMHFVDEPRTPEQFLILKDWVEAFKSGSTLVEVYNNPINLNQQSNMDYAPAALSQVDVLCPKASDMLTYPTTIRSFFDDRIKNGTGLWLYMCSANKHVDPSYFRMQPWYAFQMGATGSCFWNYSDSRGNPWNEYTTPFIKSFAMVYLDDNGPVSTRHWEAFREGIEDYEYLKMLNATLSKNIVANTLTNLEAVTLRNLDMGWSAKNPGIFADEGRLEVMAQIDKLTSSKNYTLNDQTDIIVYPNPGNGLITILSAESITDGRVEVMDVRGRIVFNTRISGTTKTLDLRGVQSGLYIVRITANHSVITKKVMIK